MTTAESMAQRIADQEAAITAAGGQSWKWQLRDKNGKWIEMGSKVSWSDKGQTRTGKITGSPKAGTATVEDDDGNKHTLTTNRLTATEGSKTPEAPSGARQKKATKGSSKFSPKIRAAAKDISDIIDSEVDPKDRKEARTAAADMATGEVAEGVVKRIPKAAAPLKKFIDKGKAAKDRLEEFIATSHKRHKLYERIHALSEEWLVSFLHTEGQKPGIHGVFKTLHMANPFTDPAGFVADSQHHIMHLIDVAEKALSLISSGSDQMADRIAAREAADAPPQTMAERIAAQEAALTAAGGQSWKWQLRDRNGKWIDMGALVKWMANGQAREGKITGSPQEGMAEVEESKTKRRLRIAANRLTVLKSAAPERDEKGALDVTAGKKKFASSQPEPDTVPEPKAEVKGAPDAETSMPQDQIDRLSKGVTWRAPTSDDDPAKHNFFQKVFDKIKNLRGSDGAVRPGRPDGAGTEEDPVYVGSDVKKAQEHLLQGHHIRMHSQQDIVSVLTADFAALMKERGIKTVNMCQVSVKGTNLFCQQDKDVIRDWMPQLSGKDAKGQTKDVQPWTEEMYDELNMIGAVENVDPNLLRASQSELKTEQIIGMADGAENYINMTVAADRLRKDGKTDEADALIAERDKRADDAKDFSVMSLDVLTEAILVTDDGYIIDGHHRWAALMVLNERLKSRNLEPLQMQVRRVQQEIGEALVTVNAIADAAGILKKSGGSSGAEPDILRESKVNPQVAARLKKWSADVDAQLGADASKWAALSKAKKVSVRTQAKNKAALQAKEVEARAKHAKRTVAASVEPGDILLMPDDTFRLVQRVLVETSGGRTFLQQDPYTGDLSLAILASAAPVVLVNA